MKPLRAKKKVGKQQSCEGAAKPKSCKQTQQAQIQATFHSRQYIYEATAEPGVVDRGGKCKLAYRWANKAPRTFAQHQLLHMYTGNLLSPKVLARCLDTGPYL